jgi:hypothetical protein
VSRVCGLSDSIRVCVVCAPSCGMAAERGVDHVGQNDQPAVEQRMAHPAHWEPHGLHLGHVRGAGAPDS